jgi:Cytochrome c554 and c-prime
MMWRWIPVTASFLAAIAVGGCTPRAKAPTNAENSTPAVTSVARRTLPPSLVLGEQACASSGCHGEAFDGKTRDWQSAYSVWLDEDPHRRAFAVLYTERSVEIYRNLNPQSKLSPGPPEDIPYEAFLGERCLGCHATGLRGRGVVPLAEGRDRPAFYLSGVTCESCHGPASGWLDTHYLAEFSRGTSGFHDTKPLSSRAEACVGCHVGPMIAANGKAYDMNHDLIAAGHPRLAFEFSSYLANLPKHWDEAKDIARHQQSAQSSSFHSDVWAAGQEQVARQLVRQIEHRLQTAKRDPNTTPWPDFSNFDCCDCHHAIGPPGNERTTSAQLAGRHNFPRPALAPLEMLRVMSGPAPPEENLEVAKAAGLVETVLNSSWQMPLAKIDQPATEELAIFTDRGRPTLIAFAPEARRQQQAKWLLASMQPWKRPAPGNPQLHRWDPTWDEALHHYSGVAALASDIDSGQPGPLHGAATRLGANLGQYSFRSLNRTATQYDSPTNFDPAAMQLDFDSIEEALTAVTQLNPRPSNP